MNKTQGFSHVGFPKMLAIFGRSEKQIDKRKQIMIICGAIRFDFERRVA